VIRIVLADDHAVVRHDLRSMLEQRSDIQVVGECDDGARAVELVMEFLPDVALCCFARPADAHAESHPAQRCPG
jgi:DNA-binding NarL/FixJ family response regulator